VLNDANLTETSGAIGINGTPDTRFRLDVNGSTRLRGSNPGFNLEGQRAAGNLWLFQTVDDDGRFRLFSQDNANPGQERLTIKLDSGNIGIGTNTPVTKLDVNGIGRFTPGGSGGRIGLDAPNGETGMVISGGAGGRADLRFNGTAIKLVAGPAGGPPPATSGITINKDGTVAIGGESAGTFKMAIVGANTDTELSAGVSGLAISGGNGNGVTGGEGIFVSGGDGQGVARQGIRSFGGNGTPTGYGGEGLVALGGIGRGAGYQGGAGINAHPGGGTNGATVGLAGEFFGDVLIHGNLNVLATKNFKIDHPLDPENKYLYHAAIESSEVLNVYSGNLTTDPNGEAVVTLPEWFEALNKDFRYQLTVVSQFAQAIVAEEIKGNRFRIRSSAPNVKVSWQVTGVRNDRGLRQQPFKVEQEKSERERGHYLQPEAFDQPEEKSVRWATHPEMMRQLKERRLEAEQQRQKQPDGTGNRMPN
jgi:hypothetical protein